MFSSGHERKVARFMSFSQVGWKTTTPCLWAGHHTPALQKAGLSPPTAATTTAPGTCPSITKNKFNILFSQALYRILMSHDRIMYMYDSREMKPMQFDRVPHKDRQTHPRLSRADAAHQLQNPTEHPRVAFTGRRPGGARACGKGIHSTAVH